MRLATLLAHLNENELARLAIEHVPTDEALPRPQLCNFLEGALRSYRFTSDFIINRQPPTFALLTLLLESPGYELPIQGFRERVLEETRKITELLATGNLLARDRQLHLYRSALYEARRSDLDVNSSEAALLAVLRREQKIAQVEHFLIEHHNDFQEFWDREDCFAHEENALLSAGLVFHHNGNILIAEEVAPSIWQTLGIDMPTDSARRLFAHLSNGEYAEILEATESRTSGSKEVRLERIILERIQPRVALRLVGLTTLKEICRTAECPSTGNKDELVERIITHFAQDKDQQELEPIEASIPESRRLALSSFETLFSALLHQELSDILRRRPELRQTGTKEVRIRTLWDAQLSEATLLGELMNRQLEDLLHRLGQRLGGSKSDRIERLVGHFEGAAGRDIPAEIATVEPDLKEHPDHVPLATDVAKNQDLFRQKASNPQASLQPWMDTLLNARGLVRCYATEDTNPTKQLKNKLSQAAAARDGVLVLLLADEGSYLKAREALLERWMTNDEWSKSIACVALAFPLATPAITAIVERGANAWAHPIQTILFPEAEILRAQSSERDLSRIRCSRCAQETPPLARFCPNCGTATDSEVTKG